MANPFDVYDDPVQSTGNPFDEYDDIQETAAPTPTTPKPSLVRPQRGEHPAKKYTGGDGSALSYIKQGVMSGLQGASLGWSDEILAGIAAPVYAIGENAGLLPESGQNIGELYSDMQRQSDIEQKQFNQDYPAASLAGEIGGGLVPAFATGGGAVGAQTLGQVAKQGAKLGAGYGAAYGAGTSEQGLENRLIGGGIGGVTGAVGGAVLAPVLNVAGRVVGGLHGAYQEAVKRTPEEKAQLLLSSELAKTGYTPQEMAGQVVSKGDDAILADANENALSILDQAVSKLGSTKDRARDFVAKRNTKEQGEMLSLLSQQLGGRGYDDMRVALAQNAVDMQTKASPLYKQALAANIENSPTLEKLRVSKSFREAYANSGKYADDVMQVISPDEVSLTGQRVKPRALTEAEKLHNTKVALQDMESKAIRDGEMNYAKRLGDQRRELTSVLDTLPGYKEARQLWSGGKGTEEAADIGLQFFKLTSKPQEFIDMVSQLNPHDREVAKMALMNAATDKAGSKGSHLASASLLTDNVNKERMLSALVGDEAVQALKANAAKWKRFRRTGNVLEGSRTNERMETGKEMDAANALLNPKGAVFNEIMSYVTPNGRRLRDPEVATAIGNYLTTPNMPENELIRILTPQAERKPFASNVTGVAAMPVQQAIISRVRE